jgi:Spy/CpxP family protein refolding chaperone
MNSIKLLLMAVMLCWVSTVSAQNFTVGEKDNRKVLLMGLYPPDILMRQQQRLGITGEQRTEIAALVRDFQGDVSELQWSMPAEQQKLREMLDKPDIDAEVALAQAARVLTMESEFKLAHFKLLIGIKNKLSDEQIDMLDRAISRRLGQD